MKTDHLKDWDRALSSKKEFDKATCHCKVEGSVVSFDAHGCCTACGEVFGLAQTIENPKEATGDKKTPHHLVPPRVLINVAWAMKEGADKYGEYNFRKAGVKFHTYYSSTRRHIDAWWEGEDIDPDSGLHHIDKAISGLIVLRDSMLQNNYQDDRPNTL